MAGVKRDGGREAGKIEGQSLVASNKITYMLSFLLFILW